MTGRLRSKFLTGIAALLVASMLVSPEAHANTERQLREARERYDTIQERLNTLAGEYSTQQSRLQQIETEIATTNREIRQATSDVDELRDQLRQRARTAYKLGGVGAFDFLLSSSSFREFSMRAVLLERQSAEDEDLILQLRRARSELTAKEGVLRNRRQAQATELAAIRRKSAEFEAAFNDAQAVLQRLESRRAQEVAAARRRAQAAAAAPAVRRSGGSAAAAASTASGRVISLQACPAAGPRTFTNDWGAPRGGGRRRHQGNDVFAPHGSPAAAVVNGRISRTSSGGNAGLSIYLWGDDGNQYFYAHMSGYAASVGDRVSAGQTIAYVGNTGNARGTAPHIHFEVHPGGGRPINPYPSLIRVC